MSKTSNVKAVKVEDIKPWERNARVHSQKQIEKLAESIENNGFIVPILIDENNEIIAGHGRLAAAMQLGMKEVPTIKVEGLSENEKAAYILLDNRLTETGEWDTDMLFSEVNRLEEEGIHLGLFDFEIGSDFEVPLFDDMLNEDFVTKDKETGEKDTYVITLIFPEEAREIIDPLKPHEIADILIEELGGKEDA